MGAKRELYVASRYNNTVRVFDADAETDPRPLREFGDMTQLALGRGLHIDPRHDEYYVFGSHVVRVYARTAQGNLAPQRSFTNPAFDHQLIAIDSIDDEIFVSSSDRNGTRCSVKVFPRAASGAVTEIREFFTLGVLPKDTLCPRGIAVDPANNEIYIIGIDGTRDGSAIAVYSRTAQGDAMPKRVIKGSNTDLRNLHTMKLDGVHKEVFVQSSNLGIVSVFPFTADGDVAPTRAVAFAGELLDIDPSHDELFFSRQNSSAIEVFPRTVVNPDSPSRVLAGTATGL